MPHAALEPDLEHFIAAGLASIRKSESDAQGGRESGRSDWQGRPDRRPRAPERLTQDLVDAARLSHGGLGDDPHPGSRVRQGSVVRRAYVHVEQQMTDLCPGTRVFLVCAALSFAIRFLV